MTDLTVLAFGDVVGRIGRQYLAKRLPELKRKYHADLVVVNAENAAGGTGPNASSCRELLDVGVDVITLGDHTWKHKDFSKFLSENQNCCIRPGNYPGESSGVGWVKMQRNGVNIGVINLIGRVFTGVLVDCPFRLADSWLAGELKDCKVVICDFHAEATSEKATLANYLDGRASLVFGTHTHVQTADERILPKGTAFITDLGMCGPYNSIIGMQTGVATYRMMTGRPSAYELGEGPAIINGAVTKIDGLSGRAISIDRIKDLES